ncbi:MAG TPA: PQQ-dependent sugar dehydrogenase, partial [Pyrinomonadaceae bacterium]|nr:PQQ-dependent sugar dehydrogenase [Pyrinomonadaceae bacterium]
MGPKKQQLPLQYARFIFLPALLAALFGYLLSNDSARYSAHAFSSGPPPGYTGAPLEEPEACAECHVPPDAGTGQISISAPATYLPGHTYPITVTHTNSDPTRLRWGFELTVLDSGDEKAGELQPLNGLTQLINNAGPGGARQYIEHTASGTFIGQQNGASWTFNWTAPSTDVGPVTFYAAGNQANNDGNTSGDYIYKTFVTSSPQSSTPHFAITATPSTRNVVPTGSAQYTITITPFAAFTGTVNLNATGLPTGASAVFNPTSLNINDANSKSSTLTITTDSSTPIANNVITITGQSGSLMHSAQVNLNVVSPSSVDLTITKTASPNPGEVGSSLVFRMTVTNNGPAAATNVMLNDPVPAGTTMGAASTTQGSCLLANPMVCSLGTITAGSTVIVTMTVTPGAPGQISNTATVTAGETDFDTSNNSGSVTLSIQAAASSPVMLDDNLTVSTVVSGLSAPTSMAFLGPNDFFVLEAGSGKVQRIVNGVLQSTVLDLPVNFASERGLLGIALHPQFAQNGFVYLYWTESSVGVDTGNIDQVPLLGNRVDRYVWNGTTLSFDKNLIKLRALQQDAGQPSRGNHNGGVLRFGLDGKLYIIFGDNGRRGLLQNIITGGPVPDDQFGGPEPDDAHMTGVILRLNDDGTTPSDNPFFDATTVLTGQAATNIKKVFAYGVRNSFGMAFDPMSGNLWTEENGDDAFDEINRVTPGFDGGWVQVMGPLARIGEFKSIEMTYGAGNLQQLRWPPSNIANTPQDALARMFIVPGSQYVDPEFSWKYAVAPSPIGFIRGRGLGPQFEGNLLVGASRTTLLNGFLYRFKLSSDRQHFVFTDPRLNDRVADNTDKFDQTESESLAIGRDFGVTTDIQTGPNGNVFVVSLSKGAVYEIKSKPSQLFIANLTGTQEVPPNNSSAMGTATLLLSPDEKTARVSLHFSGLTSAQTDAHIHGPAPAGVAAPVIIDLPDGQIDDFEISLTTAQVQDLKTGLWYVNVHSSNFPTGEIRGQFGTSSSASSIQFSATKYVVNETAASVAVTVTRLGSTSGAATVDYTTTDTDNFTVNCTNVAGNAFGRCDFATSVDTLTFAPGETSKSFVIPIINDGWAEGDETFGVMLSNVTGATLGSPATAQVTITDNETVNGAVNPYFATPFFVRQHYLDFLSREPEPTEPWSNILNTCPNVNNDPSCDRLFVSGAIFGSPEFQLKGYYNYRFYKLAFNRLPLYEEIVVDMRKVTGTTQQDTFQRRAQFASDFVQRQEFKNLYDALSNTNYVNALMNRYGLGAITTRDPNNPETGAMLTLTTTDLINALDTSTWTRAQVLRAIAESQQVFNQEFIQGFVAMQYYGYLRR